MNRVELAETLARAWNRQSIRYIVVHGVDRYPGEVGRDLDILVHPADNDLMMQVTLSSVDALGWRAAIPPDIWGNRVVAFSGVAGLELHPVTRMSWREVQLVVAPHVTAYLGSFPVDIWASYVKQILLPGFHGDVEKVVMNDALLELTGLERESIGQNLADLVLKGDRDMAWSVSRLRGEELTHHLPRLRSAMVKRSWRRAPISSLAAIYRKLLQRVAALANASGVTVRVISADGAGATDIVRLLEAADRTVFAGLVCRTFHVTEASWLSRFFESTRSRWYSLVVDRVPLKSQTIVFHVWTGTGQPRHIRSLAKLKPRPDSVVVIAANELSELQASAIQVIDSAIASYGNQLMAAAVEAFVRRHPPKRR